MMIKTSTRLTLAFAVILWGLAAAALAATNVLQVFSFDFGVAPSTHVDPTINVGDTVEWQWVSSDMSHSSTAAAGQLENWDSGVHGQSFMFTHTFQHAGTFGYFCSVHGTDLGGGNVGGMSGFIHVTNAVPNLSVTKSASTAQVAVGGTLTYTISVTNNSPTNAASVMVSDTLPMGVSFISADASQGSCTQEAGVVTCDLGGLNVGEAASVMIDVTADTQGSICNTTMVSAAGFADSAASACASVASPEVNDLAVISIKAPKTVALTGKKPSQTKFVRVTIQNRGDHAETIMNDTVLGNLVTLEVESIGSNCAPPEAELVSGSPQRPLPVTLKSKQKLAVVFSVTYDCANDPLKGAGHEDYEYYATVHHEAIDGQPDSRPADDDCPHDALGGPFKDKGCGSKQSNGTRGGDVLTDVSVKM